MKEFFLKYRNWVYGFIILFSAYSLYDGFKYFKDKAQGWEEHDKETLTNKCIYDIKDSMGLKSYDRTPRNLKEFCECQADIVQEAFSVSEYLDFVNNKSDSSGIEAIKLLAPCLYEYPDIAKILLKKESHPTQSMESTSFQKEEFNLFFDRFCSDSIFQKTRVKFPFIEVSYDIEDNQMIDSVSLIDWTFLNLKYDSSAYYRKVDAYKQIITLKEDSANVGYRGIDNGIYFDYVFIRPDSNWRLVEYIDYSN